MVEFLQKLQHNKCEEYRFEAKLEVNFYLSAGAPPFFITDAIGGICLKDR